MENLIAFEVSLTDKMCQRVVRDARMILQSAIAARQPFSNLRSSANIRAEENFAADKAASVARHHAEAFRVARMYGFDDGK